jgi:aspartyl-tRNA(Asn)/glutamyl-tRNA(Gln) amidotransferase subunit A
VIAERAQELKAPAKPMQRVGCVDPTFLPARNLMEEIASRRLSPVAVVDAFLEKIGVQDPKLHAFVEVYDEARLAAEAAEKAIRSGHAVGPLHGIPIALKDLIEIEGKVVTGGTVLWRNRRAQRTATLARRVIAQGMIIIGKTHTVEFAYGGWGTNQQMGTPWNPWDAQTARTPGGSSSGSAVAVAAGLVPWAVGTDTGGSVRLPASFCGLTGLKTTVGRVSIYGILPLSPTLDTPGPLARSVDDAALLFEAMQGSDPLDPRTLGVAPSDVIAKLKRGIRGMRLARMPPAEREIVATDVLAAYDESLEILARLGAEIAPLSLPFAFADAGALNGRIMSAEAYSILGDLVDDEKLPLDEDVRPRIHAGRDISSRAYLTALDQRQSLKRNFAEAFAGFDALLTPTTATTAVPLQSVDQSTSPAHFTRLANLLDLCALAVPNGLAQGLPTSLQIIGRGYDEKTVLRIGWAYQSATDWHERRPPGVSA